MITGREKRSHGRYYTEQNPFKHKAFRSWARRVELEDQIVLEPFAGSNNLIHMLEELGMVGKFKSYDIQPADPGVLRLDTLSAFPTQYDICISNPPWLGQYAAKRRGISWPHIQYDDLYKHCLRLALDNCDNVAFIIPATFLQSGLFRGRLESVIFLNRYMFTETENPVCMALFTKHGRSRPGRIRLYNDDAPLGTLEELERHLPDYADPVIRFNDKDGDLGLYGVDNTIGPSIEFRPGRSIRADIKFSSRSITRISWDRKFTRDTIDELNAKFSKFRKKTHDVFLTPFKGLRKDGLYRRRLDYGLARRMITKHAC
ncbi:conserved hypothetical protein [Cenarchaeum symbiosum A]|uniref:Uncharacterized protein n=1 Tax=Cenarchaeum symbiosum (strain A) TaxID=414004 RepID=A0RYG9_CENSY|nr:conserved hypothetical protein [Cenarchaeum symbiosum A]